MDDFKIEFGALPGLPGGAILSLSGPIDAKSVGTFKKQVDAVRSRRIRYLVLEMGNVRYVNSTALAYLINVAEAMRESRGDVALVNVQPKVKLIFETMGLMDFVKFYPSRAAAARDLRPVPVPAQPAPPPAAAPGPSTIRRLFRRLFGPPERRES
jgi:anti-sigma B factor antagonist